MQYDINGFKDRNCTVILIGAKKAFDKLQDPFLWNVLKKFKIERSYVNIIKATYDNFLSILYQRKKKQKNFH